jgi:membrane associated rhomboid family serine protease
VKNNTNYNPQSLVLPLTKVVKRLIIVNVVVWIVLQVIVAKFIFPDLSLEKYFGFVPGLFFQNFFVWQPVTYLFLHDTQNVLHVVLNMMMLWWLGSELEQKWGSRFFTIYYFVSGIGAALIYFIVTMIYVMVTNKIQPMLIPVIGASGAIFGLMVAYGIVFGERIVYFMFIFPMKARYFVMILGGMELMMLLNNGIGGGQVANLAHIGGVVSGFTFLIFWTWYQKNRRNGSGWRRRKLKLVVNNESDKEPKYWN